MIARMRPDVEILAGSSIMKTRGAVLIARQGQMWTMREAWEAEPLLLRCQAEPDNEGKCCGLADQTRALILAVKLR